MNIKKFSMFGFFLCAAVPTMCVPMQHAQPTSSEEARPENDLFKHMCNAIQNGRCDKLEIIFEHATKYKTFFKNLLLKQNPVTGNTPLHIAAIHENTDVIRKLLITIKNLCLCPNGGYDLNFAHDILDVRNNDTSDIFYHYGKTVCSYANTRNLLGGFIDWVNELQAKQNAQRTPLEDSSNDS